MLYLNNIDLGSVNKESVERHQVSTFTVSAYSGEVIDKGGIQSKSRRTGRR